MLYMTFLNTILTVVSTIDVRMNVANDGYTAPCCHAHIDAMYKATTLGIRSLDLKNAGFTVRGVSCGVGVTLLATIHRSLAPVI